MIEKMYEMIYLGSRKNREKSLCSGLAFDKGISKHYFSLIRVIFSSKFAN